MTQRIRYAGYVYSSPRRTPCRLPTGLSNTGLQRPAVSYESSRIESTAPNCRTHGKSWVFLYPGCSLGGLFRPGNRSRIRTRCTTRFPLLSIPPACTAAWCCRRRRSSRPCRARSRCPAGRSRPGSSARPCTAPWPGLPAQTASGPRAPARLPPALSWSSSSTHVVLGDTIRAGWLPRKLFAEQD